MDSLNNLARNRTHGLSHSSEYRSWSGMIVRCTSKTNKAYRRYGGRGISVCERWKKFKNFIADMGMKPTPKHSIDRINNDGNYEPTNCQWSTRSEQQLNRHRKWGALADKILALSMGESLFVPFVGDTKNYATQARCSVQAFVRLRNVYKTIRSMENGILITRTEAQRTGRLPKIGGGL